MLMFGYDYVNMNLVHREAGGAGGDRAAGKVAEDAITVATSLVRTRNPLSGPHRALGMVLL